MALELAPYRVPFSLPVLAGKKSAAENPPDVMPPKAALSAAFFVLASSWAWLFCYLSLVLSGLLFLKLTFSELIILGFIIYQKTVNSSFKYYSDIVKYVLTAVELSIADVSDIQVFKKGCMKRYSK
jgi:hypothetical protein